ncbi:lactococcin 972 family bacteriocin [Rathayibacter sp. VKM Ac-2857]|uniref:lactococcin 972 family bacteriocin n=1 Tax=Rathayibacter sp. VKM Ac-2857 TaxID=2739020 RepID=UPI001566952A|nr:lactococcin 972 family bacteriocin [Rathayibacter sp. VKM Ac-2857]NQX16689.1 hypothetical protein [Rathayibacter sp. VKM Ac-2857]
MSFRAPGSRRSFITGLALTGAMLIAPVAAAYTVSYPDGGKWIHGTTGGIVLSAYEHSSEKHRTSVDNGTLHRSSCQAPGVPAAISAPARIFEVDYAYYSFC